MWGFLTCCGQIYHYLNPSCPVLGVVVSLAGSLTLQPIPTSLGSGREAEKIKTHELRKRWFERKGRGKNENEKRLHKVSAAQCNPSPPTEQCPAEQWLQFPSFYCSS